jgi:hypothetical protein
MGSRPLVVVIALIGLAGCARATLPYKPEPQPPGARISAAYQIVGNQLRIEIDTGGRPLEQVWILKPGGTSLGPQTVETPPVVAGPPPSLSIGVGGGTWSHGASVGTGVGLGFPVGGGSSRVEGRTIAWFALDAAGPPPWSLYVKLNGVAPASFPVGGPLPG